MDTIQANELIIAQLFDNQPDSVVWFVPVFSTVSPDAPGSPSPDYPAPVYHPEEALPTGNPLPGNRPAEPPVAVIDFQVAYCNAAACRILNASRQQVLHASLLETPLMDPVAREQIFGQCLQVWHSGEPVEFIYHSAFFDRYFNVQRSRINDGVLSVARDRTELVKAQMEKDRQAELLNNLIESSPYGGGPL